MPIQYGSGAPSTDLPPSSSGTNLQSPSSQPATAQPASAASGSSQQPQQVFCPVPSSSAHLVGALFIIIICYYYYYCCGVAFGCMQEYFPSRTRYLLYRFILVCHSSLCDGALRVGCLATGNRQWSHLDIDFYTQFFTGRAKTVASCEFCDSTSHNTKQRPLKSLRTKSAKRPASGLLSPISTNGQAMYASATMLQVTAPTRLPASFVCGTCGGRHPAKPCSKE